MPSVKVGVSKGGPRAVPTPPQRTPFVLGSRPANLRDFPVQRTSPVQGVRDYGKQDGRTPPTGLSSGNTFQGGF